MSEPCATCSTSGRKGYCAPGRCYCGHPACHAFASWSELPALADEPAPKKRRASSWADREESTWIDKL